MIFQTRRRVKQTASFNGESLVDQSLHPPFFLTRLSFAAA